MNSLMNYLMAVASLSVAALLPQLYVSYSLKQTKFLLVLLLLLFLLGLAGRTLFVVAIFLLNLASLAVVHTHLHWGKYTGDIEPRLAVAYISPRSETWEYLATYIGLSDVLLLSYLSLSFLVSLMLYRFRVRIPLLLRLSALLLALPLIIKIKHREPVKILQEIVTVVGRNRLSVERVRYQERHDKAVGPTRRGVGYYDTIVILFGESANRRFFGLYGYDHNTTPFLTGFKNRLTHIEALAPSNQTELSIPIYLTGARPKHYDEEYIQNRSLIRAFSRAGYRTYWISNQGSAGKHDDPIRAIAQEADRVRFFNEGREYRSAGSDAVFFDYFRTSRSAENAQKEVYFLHLIGSHFDYRRRSIPEVRLHSDPKSLRDSYENSIYFTDYLIGQLYRYFAKRGKRLLIVYLSDHGEVVTPHRHGHGFQPPFREEYDVPLIFYSSIDNPRIAVLAAQKDKPLHLGGFKDYLLYICGLSDDINLSGDWTVLSLTPDRPVDYRKLRKASEDAADR